ncbi:CHAD domain-containing protein [Piscinibacter sp.]|uniref:CYTH and CHAD domain-containing protein n=1 Tax=Piscinibacter sp. TaxID=1903157 RepID=UPI0039E27C4E
MTEIELKFQVPEAARAAVQAAVAGRGGAARSVRLQAAYFDTPDGRLAAAGVALRLRREGARWVQTLKAAGDDAMTRLEHNVPRRERTALPPAPELALHDGTPAGQRLAALLGPGDELVCRYHTDIRRTLRALRRPGALLELAFDQGRIVAGAASLPVCELEIELLRGDPAALLDAARTWVARHGLWLDVRSKAERGTLLAAGTPRAAARKASAVSLPAAAGLATARRAVLGECVQQIVVNASTLAGGDFGDEHVHQLRVGLRRLRSALDLFAPPEGPRDALDAGAAALFRALGAARDQAAIVQPLRARLATAMHEAGLALAPPDWSAPPGEDPVRVLRSTAAQAWLLDALRAGLAAPPSGDDAPAAEALTERLAAWHRRVRRDAKRFAALDDEARHRLRKRAKRLRYGLEFARGLLGAKKTARLLGALAELQTRLGELNDAGVALQALREAPAPDAATGFALGWLAARRAALAEACAPALEGFIAAKTSW